MNIVEIGIKKSMITTLTIKKISEMNNGNKLDFYVKINGVAIQRDKVQYGENSNRKFNAQKLIINTLDETVEVYDFGIIKMIELNGKLAIFDGKQKLTTFIDFINNKFPLKKIDKQYENTTISNMFFRDLPDVLQKRIENTEILIGLYKEKDKNRVPELYLNTNSNGVALTQFDKDRVELCEDGKYLEVANDIGYFKAVLFKNSEKNYGFIPQNNLFELAIIKNTEGIDCITNKKSRQSIISDIKSEKINFSNLVKDTCIVLEYMKEAIVDYDGFESYQDNLSSFIHTKTLFSCAISAMNNHIPKDEFGKWVTFSMMMGNIANNQNEYWSQVKDTTTSNKVFYILQSMFNKSFFEKYSTTDSEKLITWKKKKEKELLKKSK